MSLRGGLRILGHPAHALLSDFPLALLLLAPAADVAGRLWHPELGVTAFWLLVVGLVMVLPTAVAGFTDLALGTPKTAFSTALWHMGVMLTGASLSASSLLFRSVPAEASVALGLEIAGAMTLGVGGWLGGHLVFAHGVGVERRDDQRL